MENTKKHTQPKKERRMKISEPSHIKLVEEEKTADKMEVQGSEVNIDSEVEVEKNIVIE